MERHPSAIKRNRQNKKRRANNQDIKSRMKTAIKNTQKDIESGDKEKVAASLNNTASIIAKTASKGVIHKNKAARKVSQLARKAAAL